MKLFKYAMIMALASVSFSAQAMLSVLPQIDLETLLKETKNFATRLQTQADYRVMANQIAEQVRSALIDMVPKARAMNYALKKIVVLSGDVLRRRAVMLNDTITMMKPFIADPSMTIGMVKNLRALLERELDPVTRDALNTALDFVEKNRGAVDRIFGVLYNYLYGETNSLQSALKKVVAMDKSQLTDVISTASMMMDEVQPKVESVVAALHDVLGNAVLVAQLKSVIEKFKNVVVGQAVRAEQQQLPSVQNLSILPF